MTKTVYYDKTFPERYIDVRLKQLKEYQKDYYAKNREKILAKAQEKRDKLKEE